jgi:hypothetical protein
MHSLAVPKALCAAGPNEVISCYPPSVYESDAPSDSCATASVVVSKLTSTELERLPATCSWNAG